MARLKSKPFMPKTVVERKVRKNTQGKWLTIKMAYVDREDEPSMAQLAREFDISLAQLGRKARKDNWVSQRQDHWNKIGIKVAEKCTTAVAERLIRNQKVVAGAIGYVVNQIKNGWIKTSLGDLDKLIRLEEFLHGNADSRPDFVSGVEKLIKEMGQSRAREHKAVISDDKQITEGGSVIDLI